MKNWDTVHSDAPAWLIHENHPVLQIEIHLHLYWSPSQDA